MLISYNKLLFFLSILIFSAISFLLGCFVSKDKIEISRTNDQKSSPDIMIRFCNALIVLDNINESLDKGNVLSKNSEEHKSILTFLKDYKYE